ncbi:RDD family protein [Mycolicibacter arupensis]|uniref:Membrane protein n=2 Tax=Mycolicibacter arupensis TaxID=342002 RepID=A0A0F5N015_9MYCO|nr:RDD family protein [Mycolicibacter arupensis]KKB99632.1 membrane protein [Mycolicibacter arupensis]MCV7277884.1 RDD family protein [Mycolicibacter arupensis]OQZ94026.1 RDD family protein [Mycolicibacter arupensis]
MTDTVADPPRPEPARWKTRATALVIDLLPGSAVMVTMGMAALCFPSGGLWRWLATIVGALAFLATEVNRVILPALKGWSLGRAFTGIEVVRGGEGSAPAVGVGRLLLREIAHLLDTVPVLLGWLWPLRDRRRRTFADVLARTEVRPAGERQPPANIRSVTVAVFVAAAALSLVAAGTAYSVVYQNDHKSDLAQAEIARQGPKIVADMLSYDPETLQNDFDRAQSLATEKYRQQLVPQQDAIRDANPVPNFYRVTDAAVLNSAPHRATMLLFLQGQRGEPGKERLISASVRVAFVQSSGTWRVDDLSVVSKPMPAEGDK